MTQLDLPKAYIKHQLTGRARVKIPQKRGDEVYFETLAEAFAQCETITQLQLNPQAASLLIQYGSAPFSEIAAFAVNAGLFTLVEQDDADLPATEHSSVASISSILASRLDHKLADLSAGRIDVRSVLFVAFMGLTIREAAKGHVMAPASTFLWRALQLLNKKNEKLFD
jgi:hypothetical protein